MSLSDFLRGVALLEAVVSVALSGMSLWYFAQRHPPKAVVSHVARVTAAYTAFVGYGIVEVSTHFGEPYRWQMFFLMVVFALSAHAQVPLLSYEWRSAVAANLDRPG